ncbi:MAG: AURKAIP1/COX24 domain-containing protein [Methanosarcinales archaeon]|nr:AURKAIP1/COX24 domain-containing protein [Methanosarcinales archaeon]MCK4811281.1 AURKAIP1/COX24 domain-containing protein [Methanosarcinales archaeon]
MGTPKKKKRAKMRKHKLKKLRKNMRHKR